MLRLEVMNGWEAERAKMAAEIAERGVADARVLAAMRSVPRHLFVPENLRELAYADRPLPIGGKQTISQPYMVALMAEAARLSPADRVLEIGTGSGYGAAVLSVLAASVDTVERIEMHAVQAASRLRSLGYGNVSVHVGDGTRGFPSAAPYDAIVVTAAGEKIPEALLFQLAPGGRLVVPVGPPDAQRLFRVVREQEGAPRLEDLGAVRFVPLIASDPRGTDGQT